MRKGKLIVIEGVDGSGKETQTKMLVDRLKREGISCSYMSFPQYETPTGRIVGECYLGRGGNSWFEDVTQVNPKIASLYYAADRLLAREKILKLLGNGVNVVLDRYYHSNMAHQGGKVEISKRNDLFEFVEKLELDLLKIPKEDLIVFLHMPVLIGLELISERKGKTDEHESNLKYLKKSEETYLYLVENYWRNCVKVSCTSNKILRTPEDINEEVYKIVKGVL